MDNIHTFDKYSENQEKIFTGKIKGKMKEKISGKSTVQKSFTEEIKGKMKLFD